MRFKMGGSLAPSADGSASSTRVEAVAFILTGAGDDPTRGDLTVTTFFGSPEMKH